jgi:dihydrofolate reductase
MTIAVANISMSLDGFVTGPDPGPALGLGKGGEPLHTWAVASDDEVDRSELRETLDRSGAVVMGRRLFDIIDGPHGWRDETGYGAGIASNPPFFVVTHRPPGHVRLDLDFTFISDGVEAAIAEAKRRADDKDVFVMGGGDVVRQCLDGGFIDEFWLHLAPIVLGSGTPLFRDAARRELLQRSVRNSPHATHLRYALR